MRAFVSHRPSSHKLIITCIQLLINDVGSWHRIVRLSWSWSSRVKIIQCHFLLLWNSCVSYNFNCSAHRSLHDVQMSLYGEIEAWQYSTCRVDTRLSILEWFWSTNICKVMRTKSAGAHVSWIRRRFCARTYFLWWVRRLPSPVGLIYSGFVCVITCAKKHASWSTKGVHRGLRAVMSREVLDREVRRGCAKEDENHWLVNLRSCIDTVCQK